MEAVDVMKREYRDSFEEHKNGLMALRKASDLGAKHQIFLQNEETISVSSDVAKAAVEKIMALPAKNRAIVIDRLMQTRENFIAVMRLLMENI